MRRKPGQLLPLETAICLLARDVQKPFHGYEIAKRLQTAGDSRLLTAYGTLYRALGRLEEMGLLTSTWEDPAIPARENRPGRRLYSLTAKGELVVKEQRVRGRTKRSLRGARRLRPA
jgi:PadR family transcriptional regulator, regulatory protein PadR